MKDIETRLRILHKLFNKYSEQSEVYLHSEYLHRDIRSPKAVLEIVRETVDINSAVDIGCGLGSWLSVLIDQGVDDVLGIDGDHLPLDKIMIPEEKLLRTDLDKAYPEIGRKYDLAICLEVAEHLSPDSADALVKFLTGLSDAVLFSAAIPYQGGINHVNEQWTEYWREKFNQAGFEYYDLIRSRIWNSPDVKWWYKQNCFLVLKNDVFKGLEQKEILNLVHPELFLQYRILNEK
ncbi:class I SAM-dependent methyltransferase [Chryseobacterium kwangjuense]|uniref:Class I SAM-dependent methyltransferase n=1 Tax=Chryseobacterium kwangjuense TaxID=267125 RepID=A0ABW9K478_9FLAO